MRLSNWQINPPLLHCFVISLTDKYNFCIIIIRVIFISDIQLHRIETGFPGLSSTFSQFLLHQLGLDHHVVSF